MPTLYRYTEDSNSGTGYYVHAGVNGSVVTLQTNPIVEELYDELGYEAATFPEGGGDNLPGRLVWSLYRIGLHYTENTGVDTDRDALLDSLQSGDVQLKSEEVDELQTFIQKNLDRNEKLFEVAEHLDIDIDEKSGEETRSNGKQTEGESLRDVFLKVTDEGYNENNKTTPYLPKDVDSALTDWGISTDPDEMRELLASNATLQDSVCQMHDHTWEVEEVHQNGGVLLYHIYLESLASKLPQASERLRKAVDLIVIDLRASNEVQGIEDIAIPKTDVEFGIILSAPRMESNLHMYLETGHIIGFPSIDESVGSSEMDSSSTAAIHRKLGYSSFLYAATEEFAKSLNEYELADPYSPKTEGVVKFFHDKKGYGFIEQNDGDDTKDVFFHMAEIEGPDLEEGDRVRVEVIEEEDGLRAKKLERI